MGERKMPNQKHYKAFISYSHDDEAFGSWLPKALENSDVLIVVCSTKSADSKWVNKEIIDFKMMHGEDRIFPIIVDGEPFARESDKFEDILECFPEALKYKVDSEGNLTDERTEILDSVYELELDLVESLIPAIKRENIRYLREDRIVSEELNNQINKEKLKIIKEQNP